MKWENIYAGILSFVYLSIKTLHATLFSVFPYFSIDRISFFFNKNNLARNIKIGPDPGICNCLAVLSNDTEEATISKVIHFRPKTSERTNATFHAENANLDFIDVYKYLGVYFNQYLDFSDHANILAESGGRALGSIINRYKRNKFIAFSTYAKLFENCVLPILNYCSGVWGFGKHEKLDHVQHRALRVFLGVHKYAPLHGLHGDCGWIDMKFTRSLEIMRLWNRLLSIPDNKTFKTCFSL